MYIFLPFFFLICSPFTELPTTPTPATSKISAEAESDDIKHPPPPPPPRKKSYASASTDTYDLCVTAPAQNTPPQSPLPQSPLPQSPLATSSGLSKARSYARSKNQTLADMANFT
jgi:hypothetical protein